MSEDRPAAVLLTGEFVISDSKQLARSMQPMTEQTVNQQSIDAGTTAQTNVSTTGAVAQQQTTAQEHHAEVNRRGMESDQKFAQNLSEQQALFSQRMAEQQQLFAATITQVVTTNAQTLAMLSNQNMAANNNALAAYYASLGIITIIP
jgi:hypothetical protein